MPLEGKGFFTWIIPSCDNGDVEAIAALAKNAGLTHILIKVANTTGDYNIDLHTGVDHALNLAKALRAQGVAPWGWHYVIGDNPIGEANKAILRIQQLGLDGYVIDAEEEYKLPGKREAAKRFMSQLRSVLPDFSIALSSYRFPAYHGTFPFQEFLEKCDYNMPQVYWMKSKNAGEQLVQCVHQFQAITPHRPIIPTGAAFHQNGWQPTQGEVLEFLQTAKSLNLSAANFWEWSNARTGNLPGVWETIRDFSWNEAPAPKDICEKLVAAWNTRATNRICELYADPAVHINAARSVQGLAAIGAWYSTLITQILPNPQFTLTGYSGTGSSRHFRWTAVSSLGRVLNGDDTLGLVGEKIVYHFTFFTVSP